MAKDLEIPVLATSVEPERKQFAVKSTGTGLDSPRYDFSHVMSCKRVEE